MILEIADFTITPGQNAAFEEAIERGLCTVLSQAKGFERAQVTRSQETPERYVLQIVWTTLENHTVDFRQSSAFGQWRAIISPFFAKPPVVEHFDWVYQSAATSA